MDRELLKLIVSIVVSVSRIIAYFTGSQDRETVIPRKGSTGNLFFSYCFSHLVMLVAVMSPSPDTGALRRQCFCPAGAVPSSEN